MSDPKETSVELPSKAEAKKGSCDYEDCGCRPVVARDMIGLCYCKKHAFTMALARHTLEVL